jgi:hypothetical protein
MKSKYSEACLESPSILPPTSGLKRQVVSQNSLLYGLYRKGTKYVDLTKEGIWLYLNQFWNQT